ncbi:hypothetical protein M8J75_016494 [Diaphorina citri]|nr:hypothetical protein M8J75_016494 [Diaphorina citri]
MGGTDLMDENVNRYRVSIWSKKWWWAIFTCCLHVAVQNAWVLYKREVNAGMTQLQFRREIVQHDLVRYKTQPRHARQPRVASSALDTRFDRTDHLVAVIPDRRRRRCVGLHCTTKARTMCTKSDVGQ